MSGLPSTVQLQDMFAPIFALIDSAGEDIVVRENTGPGVWADHPAIKAKPSAFRPEDIVAGSTLEQGDFKLIVRANTFPVARRLEQKDRITWRGRDWAVTEDDHGAQYSIGGVVYARVLQVRG